MPSNFNPGSNAVTKGPTIASGDADTTHQFTGSVLITGSLTLNGQAVTAGGGGGGGGGIAFDGSTANGVATYKSATTASVESSFTFDGATNTLSVTGTFNHTGTLNLSGALYITSTDESTPMLIMDDLEAAAIIGRAQIGSDQHVSVDDYAMFAHRDLANTSNFALRQNGADGVTDINSPASVKFRVGSAVKAALAGDGNFGIGANYIAPAFNLDVSGGARLGGATSHGEVWTHQITGTLVHTGSSTTFYVPDFTHAAFTISGSDDIDVGDPTDGLYFGVNTGIKSVQIGSDAIVTENKKMWFGSGSLITNPETGVGDTYISYDRDEGRLTISGSDNGIKFSGSINAPEISSGTLAGDGSYIGLNADSQLVLATAGGGGGSPGGSDTQIQFNDGGSFGGEANLTFDKTQSRLFINAQTLLTGTISVSGTAAVGTAPSYDGQGGDGVVLRIEGGGVNQDQGKSVLTCQVTGSNSGEVGYVGVGTTSPKVTLDVRWSPDLDDNAGGGDVVSFGNDTGLLSGALYYLHSSGQWMSASADATGSGASQLLAIALGSSAQGSEADAGGMLIRGWVNTTRYNGAYIQGGAIYIESGSGGGFMSGAAPTASDSYARIVGYASTNANMIYFNPGTNWVELS